MKIIHSIVVSALVAQQLVLQSAVTSWAEPPDWQHALNGFKIGRATAENCAALLKKYGDDAQKARGESTYTNAKADSDAVIDGLIEALSPGVTPGGLPELEAKLSRSASSSVSRLGAVCGKLIPDAVGQKDVLADIVSTLERLPKMLSDGITAISTHYTSDDATTRRTIRFQLEAAKWSTFSEVKAAP